MRIRKWVLLALRCGGEWARRAFCMYRTFPKTRDEDQQPSGKEDAVVHARYEIKFLLRT